EYKASRKAIDDLKKLALPGDDLRGLRNKIQTMESTQTSMNNTIDDLKKKLEALAKPAPEKEASDKAPDSAGEKQEGVPSPSLKK
ncbi:MAG: hypothetical protein HOH33_00680, partial [Verrucomicrobia bacterium]|nr:hypothetical protein [Verrucomicrobiota bacterium]